MENKTIQSRLIPSSRFTLAILIFFGCVVQYTQRINLSISIVCMINKTNTNSKLESTFYLTSNKKISSEKIVLLFQEKQFPWAESEQQMVLGAYWIGYLITLIPGN